MRNSVLPIPWTQRDSRPLSQSEQDKVEKFNAHRRLNLPVISYRILGPNERVLLRLEEEDLQLTQKGLFDNSQLQRYQKKKYKKHRKTRPKKEKHFEVLKPKKVTPYQGALNEHLETIFGIPIPL